MGNRSGYSGRFIPWVWGALLLIGCVYFLLAMVTPRLHDDLNFIDMYRRANGGDAALTAESWWNYLQMIRMENDGRFGNCLEIIFLHLPQWIFAIVMELSAMMWIGGSTVVATGRERTGVWPLGMLWMLIILFLPWHDDILGCMNFELNYVVSSGVATLFLVLLIRAGRGFRSRLYQAGCIAIAFVGGGFHEGFSMPIVCGLIGWLILKKQRPSRLQAWMLVAAIAGICVDVFSEGMITRIGQAGSTAGLPLRNVLRCLTLPCLIVAIGSLALLFRQGRLWLRELWVNPRISLLAVMCLVGTAMALGLKAEGRVAWAADWFGAMLAVAVLMRSRFWRVSKAITIAQWAVITVFYCNVIYHQHRYFREAEEVMELYEQSPDGVVDYAWEAHAPITTLHHVCRWNLYDEGPVNFIMKTDSLHRRLQVNVIY